MDLLAVNPKKRDDKFYRYKMPRIQVKVEGKGNGIKTVVVNLSTVAQSLARPGSHVIKWFGLDRGAQTNIDPPDDRWIINGSHEAGDLQSSLDIFIRNYVLCDDCGNPETVLIFKDDDIQKDCKACGARSKSIKSVKNLNNFILKTQPKKGKKDKKTRAERQAARRAKQQAAQNGENGDGSGADENSDNSNENAAANGNGNANGNVNGNSNGNNVNGNGKKSEDHDDGGSDDEFTRRINADALVIEAPKEVKDDDWAVDMSEEAVKARQQQLPSEFRQKLVIEDDDAEGDGPTAYDELGEWVLEEASKAGVDKIEDIEIYKKARDLGIETKYKTVLVLVQTLFDENIVSQIPKRAAMLKQLVKDPETPGKNSDRHEKALLGGLERFLADKGKEHPKLMTPDVISNKILYQLYDKELISEDFVKKWGTKASKKYCDLSSSREIRRCAQPFLKWLEEAESDEDSDE